MEIKKRYIVLEDPKDRAYLVVDRITWKTVGSMYLEKEAIRMASFLNNKAWQQVDQKVPVPESHEAFFTSSRNKVLLSLWNQVKYIMEV